MPDFVITPIYRVEELASPARDAALDWGRRHVVPDDWYDCVFDDFVALCSVLGVELATRPVRLYGGGTRAEPRIQFSGFASQGDGASFAGHYRYAKRSAAAIRAYAPTDHGLHGIADALASIQRRNLYQLEATIRQDGRYSHEYTMAVTVERASATEQAPSATAEEEITESLRDLARWLYRRLEREYDFQMSDAQVDAALRANDYTFTEAGARFP